MQQTIIKYALQNAILYNGKADPKRVLGKVLSDNPELRSEVAELQIQIKDEVDAINKLTIEEQRRMLEKIAPELLEKKESKRKEGLKELPNAEKGKVIMRAAPSPSGPLHIGHSIILSLNSEYCRMYDGKMILRIEDTNSENIYTPAYEMIPEEAKWVTKDNISQVMIQSERLEIYYNYALQLIDMGGMYICDCDNEEAKELLSKKEACPCRDLPKEAQVKRWHDMFTKYQQGEAVARVKTELDHPNPAMRDFPAFRINESEHPRQGLKYKVWPLMNFSVFVDDVESGVTHSIRGKDHADNAKRQAYLYKYFKKPEPVSLFIGRVNFTDLRVSCSKTRPLIEDGTYTGWDDPRLAFLSALRKRGYQPEAFIKYALSLGVTLNDKNVEGKEFFKTIDAFNREIIEPKTNRYFFIKEPVQIKIENAPKQEVELHLHTEHRKGGRNFDTNEDFYVEKEDLDKIKEEEIVRLMDCLNFTRTHKGYKFVDLEYETFKQKGKKIIHWLPAKENTPISVRMPDNSVINGIAEESVDDLETGTIVQFERFGFARKDSEKEFYYLHR
jgi:glutamyl-tRNA synthetase